MLRNTVEEAKKVGFKSIAAAAGTKGIRSEEFDVSDSAVKLIAQTITDGHGGNDFLAEVGEALLSGLRKEIRIVSTIQEGRDVAVQASSISGGPSPTKSEVVLLARELLGYTEELDPH